MTTHDWYLYTDTGEWECISCRRIVANWREADHTEICHAR